MKITWFGHSAFSVELGSSKILIDPFLSGNPSWDGSWEGPAEGCTHVLLTHGHADHLGDAFEICKASGAMLVSSFEICMYAVGQGVAENQINPGNPGGTVPCGDFTTSFTTAVHSSSFGLDDGSNVYLGNPMGLIIKAEGEKTLYHMGDTDIFGDMALINELHEPKIGIVPVGDRFTMGAQAAALACTRYFKFEKIIPCHYGSFPIIDPDASKFVDAMDGQSEKINVATIGETFEL